MPYHNHSQRGDIKIPFSTSLNCCHLLTVLTSSTGTHALCPFSMFSLLTAPRCTTPTLPPSQHTHHSALPQSLAKQNNTKQHCSPEWWGKHWPCLAYQQIFLSFAFTSVLTAYITIPTMPQSQVGFTDLFMGCSTSLYDVCTCTLNAGPRNCLKNVCFDTDISM